MTSVLGLGKVSRDVFNRSVLPNIPVEKKIELDGATTCLSGKTVIAHSPSIGVPTEALGFFAFHYSAGNVASKFGKPRHLISGIYLPLRSSEKELAQIAKSLGNEARKYGVYIMAGQTATYYGLEIPLLTATCMGERIRTPRDVLIGDVALLVGSIGGEAIWLNKLSRGEQTDIWREFTPLPAILSLQKIHDIKLMHDISEGGLKGSLLEIATINQYGLRVASNEIPLYPGADKLSGDIFKAPTYGALIVIADSEAVREIQSICFEQGLTCTVIGEVTSEPGLVFDKQQITELERVDLDEIYGSLTKKDSVIVELSHALASALELDNLIDLVPEVGLNMVYSKPDPRSPQDVAGLSGRVINAMGKAMACGEVTYGASRYLSSVIIEATRLDSSKRAAVDIRGGDDLHRRLESIGLRVQILPHKIVGDRCPVAFHLKNSEKVLDAYVHPGDFGIEPTTTIIGDNPEYLVGILEKLV
jgi:hydrogenase maturation factor/predicted fused transcriptional regulator/phosphomethylpyrimidine kinase